jgi:hypothetical protein
MLKAIGSAENGRPVIAGDEKEGALWYDQPVLLSPRFSLHFTVFLDSACMSFISAWANDGFVVTLSKTTNYLRGGGGALGYLNIFDALVGEFDFYRNSDKGDIGDDTMSIHKCFKKSCNDNEIDSKQVNLPFVHNYYNFRIHIADAEIAHGISTSDMTEAISTICSVITY